jgi:bacillithiol system protein YtxJ
MQAARITTLMELDHAFEASRERPVLFFKHSLTCPVSTAAWQAYLEFLEGQPAEERVLYTLIEIQKAREISREVETRTGLKHESPQALLVRDGKVVWSASHWDITAESIAQAVA